MKDRIEQLSEQANAVFESLPPSMPDLTHPVIVPGVGVGMGSDTLIDLRVKPRNTRGMKVFNEPYRRWHPCWLVGIVDFGDAVHAVLTDSFYVWTCDGALLRWLYTTDCRLDSGYVRVMRDVAPILRVRARRIVGYLSCHVVKRKIRLSNVVGALPVVRA